MLDLKKIISEPDKIRQRLAIRGQSFDWDRLLNLQNRRKTLQLEFDALRAKQNEMSEEIQRLQKDKQDLSTLLFDLKSVAKRVKEIQPDLVCLEKEIEDFLLEIPNLPDPSVPIGKSAEENREVRYWGEKPQFDFLAKPHWDIGERLKILDFERAAKIAGSRFTLYFGLGAKLERALIQFMLDLHTTHGYLEVLPPFLVNSESLLGTGQLPKFEEDLFKTTAGYYLIPTAEVPVTNIHRDEILREDDLPISYVAYTPCFRSEAGSYGKDVRGLTRQHQFNKIELVRFVKPESSAHELELLTSHAENVLRMLELPYRVVELCSGDLGFSSAKTYDLEVWLPGQMAYREISSCSNFGDFQARRSKIRFKSKDGKNHFVHTLNGSGLAVGRTLMAILENYQQADGSVKIPQVLRPYLGGLEQMK